MCRRKKVKCPSERPSCGYCVRLGQECQYASDTAAAGTTGSKRTRGQSIGSAVTGLANVTPVEPPSANFATPQSNIISLASTVSTEHPWTLTANLIHQQSDLAARVAQLEAQLSAQSERGTARSGSIAMVDDSQDQESMPPPVKRKLSNNPQATMQRPSISVAGGSVNAGNEDSWYGLEMDNLLLLITRRILTPSVFPCLRRQRSSNI